MPPAWLTNTTDFARSTWNVISSVGPWLISQSDASSEAYARHQERLANVEITKEVSKELLMQEVHLYGEAKKKLLDKWADADSTEKVHIKCGLQEIDASMRAIKVSAKALTYLPEPNQRDTAQASGTPSSDIPNPEVTAHWMDRFSELARAHNEPWREDMLARALAQESAEPGTVTPRVLWLIGTLDQETFNAFATMMDLAIRFNNRFVIPSHEEFNHIPIPNCLLGNTMHIGSLGYYLEDTGLLADERSVIDIEPNQNFLVSYDDFYCVISSTENIKSTGILHTRLGESLARFYKPKFNPLGRKIFEAWVSNLDATICTVRRVIPAENGTYRYVYPVT